MKKLLLTNIIANVRRQRLPKSSVEHLQQSYSEGFEGMLKSLNVDPATVTILSGSDVGVAGSDYTIAAGWAAFGGEVFQVDAHGFTVGGGETGVWVVDTSYSANDPVSFDDGNAYNVNEIRKLKLQSGASGSGLTDYNSVHQLKDRLFTLLEIQAALDALVDAAPGALDTLNELAAALGNDPDFATTVTNALAEKLSDTEAVLNGGNTGANTKLLTKVVEIGAWNMDSDSLKTVNIGVSKSMVRSVSVIIRQDDDPLNPGQFGIYDLIGSDGNGGAASGQQANDGGWTWSSLAGSVITLFRLTSGFFDSASFDSTGHTRGWVTVTYEA